MYMKQWIICFTWYMKSPCLSTVLKKKSEWRSKNLDKKILGILNCYVKKIKTIALITIFFKLSARQRENHKHIKVIAFRSVIEVFWIDFSNIMHNNAVNVCCCCFWNVFFDGNFFVFVILCLEELNNLGFWVKSVGNPWLWYFDCNLEIENFGRIFWW